MQKKLIYSEIPLLTVQKEFSIGESEEYLPTNITQVLVGNTNQILVLQSPDKSIHQFDSNGNYLSQIARQGKGPGELSQYAYGYYDGEILLMSNNNSLITEFSPNEDGIYEYSKDYSQRMNGMVRGFRTEGESRAIFVSVDSSRAPFGTVPPEFTTEFIHIMNITEDSVEREEKVLTLKTHSSYVEIQDGGNSMSYSGLPYRYSDGFSLLSENKVMVQRPLQSSIEVYDEKFDQIYHLQLNVEERAFTEEDLEYHFPNLNSDERRKRRSFIMDIKPPFLSVRFDNQNRFWLQTHETTAGREYIILSYDGEPLGRFYIPKESSVYNIKNGKIYTVNSVSEPKIEVYSVNL